MLEIPCVANEPNRQNQQAARKGERGSRCAERYDDKSCDGIYR